VASQQSGFQFRDTRQIGRQAPQHRQFTRGVGTGLACAQTIGLDLQDGDLVEQFAPRHRDRRAGHWARVAAIAASTEAHSPSSLCRNNRTVGAVEHPAPVRHPAQRDPDRPTARPRKMGDGSIGRMIRSNVIITAAVSRNASGPSSSPSRVSAAKPALAICP